MTKQGLSFQREPEIQIYYDEQEIGLLINFGAKSLQFRSIINSKKTSASSA
jgi:hypothetical protein